MRTLFLLVLLVIPFTIFNSCNEELESENSFKLLNNSEISQIKKMTLDETETVFYKIELKNFINGYNQIIIAQNPKNKNRFISFINKSKERADIYDESGGYQYSVIYDENNFNTIIDPDLNVNFNSKSCFSGCMDTSYYNWMADSNGNPSDGLEAAFNQTTWNSFGEAIAIGYCGGCCEGLWSCPTRVKPQNPSLSIYSTPNDIPELEIENLIIPIQN